MAREDDLWAAVGDLFEKHDGSLPEIEIEGVEPEGAQVIFDTVIRLGRPTQPEPTVWDELIEEDVRIRETPKVGLMAAQGRMGTLHFVLTDLAWECVAIPDLGIRIQPGSVIFDYYMGPAWTPRSVAALVRLLAELKQLGDGDAFAVWVDGSEEPDAGDTGRFREAVDRYLAVG